MKDLKALLTELTILCVEKESEARNASRRMKDEDKNLMRKLKEVDVYSAIYQQLRSAKSELERLD